LFRGIRASTGGDYTWVWFRAAANHGKFASGRVAPTIPNTLLAKQRSLFSPRLRSRVLPHFTRWGSGSLHASPAVLRHPPLLCCGIVRPPLAISPPLIESYGRRRGSRRIRLDTHAVILDCSRRLPLNLCGQHRGHLRRTADEIAVAPQGKGTLRRNSIEPVENTRAKDYEGSALEGIRICSSASPVHELRMAILNSRFTNLNSRLASHL
jgi:hypothetical protein